VQKGWTFKSHDQPPYLQDAAFVLQVRNRRVRKQQYTRLRSEKPASRNRAESMVVQGLLEPDTENTTVHATGNDIILLLNNVEQCGSPH
jgi:hypothetical protein